MSENSDRRSKKKRLNIRAIDPAIAGPPSRLLISMTAVEKRRHSRNWAPSFTALGARSDGGLDGRALIEALLDDAVRSGASDVHVDPLARAYRIRFRIDGTLEEAALVEREIGEQIVRAFQVAAEIDSSTVRHAALDGRLAAKLSGETQEIRIATAPGLLGDKVTARLLQQEHLVYDLNRLGMDDGDESLIKEALDHHDGMILVSGPTGCGKTTTAYAFLRELLSHSVNLLTLEDPIEYRLEGATQVEIDEETGLTFAGGIRSLLRHDPDCLFIGEIRDEETAANAIDATFSGHAVISTVHARQAVSTVTMLRALNVPNHLVAAALRLVINQRLVRRLCDACKDRRKPTTREEEWMKASGLEPTERVHVARGCDHCAGSGYHGRRAIFELWPIDDDAYEAILRGADDRSLSRLMEEKAARSLGQRGRHLMERGEISLTELRGLL